VPALRFVFLGVPVEIQAPFFLLMGALGLVSYRSPGALVAWLAIALIAVLAHEAGHAAAFRAFGDRPSVVLHGGGGMTTGGDHGVARMVAVTAAGPVAGIALGLLVALGARLAPAEVATSPLVGDALFLTIGLSLLNLVPMRGFDGSAILNGLVTLAIGRPAGAIGWMIGALTVLTIVIGASVAGRVEIAIFVVIFVIINSAAATSLPALFGAPSGTGSPVELLNLGRADEALAKAEEASRRDPANGEAVYTYGAALLAMTRYADAETLYSGLLAREPDSLRALSGRFSARRALGRVDEAAPDLAALLARPPVGIVEIGAQFQALYRDRQYERGLELIRSELARPGVPRPEAFHLRMLEAAMESVGGYPEAALRHADELIAMRPDMAPLHEAAALALIQLGRVEEALVRARRALTGAPRHPELIETVGIAERLCGRPEAALPLLLQAATARPDMPRARAELSACFTQLGRHVEAAAALDNLPAWAMDDPTVIYARGCILAAAGRLAEAADHVEQGSQLRPALAWVARVDPILRPLGLAAP
jgi:tetratricopeptide (TPR) repeat protein/Zn-dependent protease